MSNDNICMWYNFFTSININELFSFKSSGFLTESNPCTLDVVLNQYFSFWKPIAKSGNMSHIMP